MGISIQMSGCKRWLINSKRRLSTVFFSRRMTRVRRRMARRKAVRK